MNQTPTILVVEDELSCRNLYREALSSRDINVIMADEGTVALNLLRHGLECSVIIADYGLPDMDGFYLLDEARKLSPASTKIMITARKKEEMQTADIIQAEIFQFITKPIDVNQFIETVLSGINRYQQKIKNGNRAH